MTHRLCPKCGRTIFGIQTYCLECIQGKGILGFFCRIKFRLSRKIVKFSVEEEEPSIFITTNLRDKGFI